MQNLATVETSRDRLTIEREFTSLSNRAEAISDLLRLVSDCPHVIEPDTISSAGQTIYLDIKEMTKLFDELHDLVIEKKENKL